MTDAAGATVNYTYDAGNRLTGSNDTADPSIAGGFGVTRSYDAAGNVSGLCASGETTRTYTYDLAHELTSLVLPNDPSGRHTTYRYDRSGLLTSRSLPDSSAAGLAYDAAGRLASITDTLPSSVLSYAYTRDANGNVTAENSTRYTYDALNRLSSWYDPSANATTTYSYDAAYNLTQVSVNGSPTATFIYDDADRISSAGYAYAANGNMTSDGTRTYRYDELNRLSAVINASTQTTIASYAYDYLNRRTKTTDASGATYFHYDAGSANVIAETDGAGHTTATYAYDVAGRLHSMTRDGATYYYHTNAHGDVVALTDTTGSVVDSYCYDPWGKVLQASETVANPYRYAGYRYDASTGLYYLWNRYYSPGTMGFITKDIYPGQTMAPAMMNGYLYCLANPVNAIDPSGLWTSSDGFSVSAGVFGAGFQAHIFTARDDQGDFGVGVSLGPLGTTPFSASLMRCTALTNARTVDDLRGWSVNAERQEASLSSPEAISSATRMARMPVGR